MAMKTKGLSVAHRYGTDSATGTNEVVALTLIHLFRSKAMMVAILAVLAGLDFITFEILQGMALDPSADEIGNTNLSDSLLEADSE